MTSLVKGSDGRFYVTAGGGGAAGGGTIFTIDDAGTVTILHSFGGLGRRRRGTERLDASSRRASVRHDRPRWRRLTAEPCIRSTPPEMITESCTVFKLTLTVRAPARSARSQRRKPLWRDDSAIVVQDRFERDPDDAAWSDRFLAGRVDSRRRRAPVRADSWRGPEGAGTIIRLDAGRDAHHALPVQPERERGRPNGVIQARNGQFYGTTRLRPVRCTGTVFAMDAAGARTTLHTFDSSPELSDGTPMSNLFEGTDGSLYGTTFNQSRRFFTRRDKSSGSALQGTSRGSSRHWLRAGVIQARDGRLYGTRPAASVRDPAAFGDVFRVEANGTRTALHRFDGSDRVNPVAELVEIDDGSLYGTTAGFYRTSPPAPDTERSSESTRPPGRSRRAIVSADPMAPTQSAALIQGTDGLIYGTTSSGGAYGFGTVFSLDAAAHSPRCITLPVPMARTRTPV